jgi:cytochrome c biogenesis protein CcdA
VNGTVYGNAVSPDTVILVSDNTENSGFSILIYAAILALPVAAAAGFTAYLAAKGGKKKKNVKRGK